MNGGNQMTMTENQYRCFTSQEIGDAIARFRKVFGLKQINAAHDARVDERTVQRIEQGKKVDQETLRKVARALRMEDENYFIRPHHFLSPEEASERATRALDAVMRIDAHRLANLRDCEAVLGTDGKIVDDCQVTDAAAVQAARFKDSLEECKYGFSDSLSHEEKVHVCQSLLLEVKRLEAFGYVLRYGIYKTQDNFNLSVMLLVPKADDAFCEVKHMLVPSRFTQTTLSL
jgi:transcriptional regulator with XRE-family HTH domain